MSQTRYQLAQLNIGSILGPIDGPIMADFAALLDEINAIAERSPGFIWRLQASDGNATSFRPFDDDNILVNLSVWESVEQLHAYVYRSAHGAAMRRRREWFEPMRGGYVALWWVPAGHRPSLVEARQRLEHLAEYGPSTHVFTFKQAFPPPAA